MMRSLKGKFVLAVAWQVLLLAGLLIPRAYTMTAGTTVVLKTVPVDPRDLFRGDYVVLRYEVSRLNLHQVEKRIDQPPLKPRETVYVVLTPGSWREQEPWAAEAVFDRPPTEAELAGYDRKAVFVRGTVSARPGDALEVDYGIESYFVPEGRGKELERAVGKGLAAEIRVDRRGGAVIRRLLPGDPAAG